MSTRPVSERHIEKYVCGYAKGKGCFVHKMQTGIGGTAGMPDRLFHYRGTTLYIEFKAPGKKPSPIQTVRIAELQKHGMVVHVVDSVQLGVEVIDEYTRAD